jgi:hypothetical protein
MRRSLNVSKTGFVCIESSWVFSGTILVLNQNTGTEAIY